MISTDSAALERFIETIDTGRSGVPVATARRQHDAGGQFDVIDTMTG